MSYAAAPIAAPRMKPRGPCKRPPRGTPKAELRELHRTRMARKAKRRDDWHLWANNRERTKSLWKHFFGV